MFIHHPQQDFSQIYECSQNHQISPFIAQLQNKIYEKNVIPHGMQLLISYSKLAPQIMQPRYTMNELITGTALVM